MKKIICLLALALAFTNCGNSQNKTEKPSIVTNFVDLITANDLKEMLYTFASDAFEGRRAGEPGQKKAIAFLKDNYVALDIPSPIAENDYYKENPESILDAEYK